MILLLVWPASGDGSALTSKTDSKVNLLNHDTYRWVFVNRNCVILRTDRARCALSKEFLHLLDQESINGACSGRANL